MSKIDKISPDNASVQFNAGFTLVELMVVLAILGVLMTVVWSQVANALLKGKDSAIRADMDTIRKLALDEFINLNTKYSATGAAIIGDCSTLSTANTMYANPRIQQALIDVKNQNGGIALSCEINATGSAYAIAATLRTPGKYWCIDSTGVAKGTYGSGSTDYAGQYNSGVNYAIWPNSYACS